LENRLKQRLVGAIILLALGTVFWPIIFAPLPETSPGGRAALPAPPRVDTTPLPAPSAAGLRRSPAPESAVAAPEKQPDVRLPETAPAAQSGAAPADPEPAGTRDTPPEQPRLDADGIPIAWALQVATVSSRDKAEQLRDQLIDSGEKAFLRPLRRGGDTLYRVYVGPKFERAQIESIKARVDRRYGVDSLVARYVP
jgi:DedD protein